MKKILVLCVLMLPLAACKSNTKSIQRDSAAAIALIEGGKVEAKALEPHVAPEGMPILKSMQKRWDRLGELASSIQDNADHIQDTPGFFGRILNSIKSLLLWGLLIVAAVMLGWGVLKGAFKAGALPGAGMLVAKLAKKGIGLTSNVVTQANLLVKTHAAAKESGNPAVVDASSSTITAFRGQSPAHDGAYQRAKQQLKPVVETPQNRVRPPVA